MRLNKHKKKLIILLSIQVVLTIIHKVLDKPTNIETWYLEVGWHYWVALVFGTYVMLYAFTLSCKKCGAKQVWGGINILKYRWPADKCWSCNEEIK